MCEPTTCIVCVCFHGVLFTFVCYLCLYVVLFLLLALAIIIIIIIIITVAEPVSLCSILHKLRPKQG